VERSMRGEAEVGFGLGDLNFGGICHGGISLWLTMNCYLIVIL
jgi:hypothetical protein